MSKFDLYIQSLDLASKITDEDIKKTEILLRLYGSILRRTAQRLDEYAEECYDSRRQSIADFINLAIDYDHDADRKRITDRLVDMGHSMQLLSLMDHALVLLRDNSTSGGLYYEIIRNRFFNAYCTSNEDAFLSIGISSATYYRHIKAAIRAFAANLWLVVIPDLIIHEQQLQGASEHSPGELRVS